MIQSVWKNLTGLQKAAEHLWCDFKWAKNSSTNTNDFIHYMDKSTGTPSLEEKKCTSIDCDTSDISYTSKLLEIQFLSTWIMFPSLLAQFVRVFFSSKEGVPVLLSI